MVLVQTENKSVIPIRQPIFMVKLPNWASGFFFFFFQTASPVLPFPTLLPLPLSHFNAANWFHFFALVNINSTGPQSYLPWAFLSPLERTCIVTGCFIVGQPIRTFVVHTVVRSRKVVRWLGGNLSIRSVGGTSATQTPSELHSVLSINPYNWTFPNCNISFIMDHSTKKTTNQCLLQVTNGKTCPTLGALLFTWQQNHSVGCTESKYWHTAGRSCLFWSLVFEKFIDFGFTH